MKTHDAANIFPLDEASIPELAEDIRKHGLLTPIELLGGAVLDGRRRLKACELVGVKPRFKDVSPADPVAYVLSLNLHRRHLSPSQLTMVGARARDWYDKEAKKRQKDGQDRGRKSQQGLVVNLPPTTPPRMKARDAVAKAVGVSGASIDFGTKVLAKAEPELVKAVDEGRVAVSRAAKLVDEPAEVQIEAAATGGCRLKPKPATAPAETEADPAPTLRGIGVVRANEAINCLIRIPKNDPQRKVAGKIVTDWIKANLRE